MDDEAGANDSAIHDVLLRPWVGPGLIGSVALISRLTVCKGAEGALQTVELVVGFRLIEVVCGNPKQSLTSKFDRICDLRQAV
jgi:hypothetical protein